MTKNQQYSATHPVRGQIVFEIREVVAKARYSPPAVDSETAGQDHRKIEVGFTQKGNIVVRRVVYGSTKVEAYTFPISLNAVVDSLDVSRPESNDAINQIKNYLNEMEHRY